MTLTRESVLARITEKPTRFCDIAVSRSYNSKQRTEASTIVAQLKAEGLIRQQYLDRIPYLVPFDWKPDDTYWQLQIDDRSRRTMDGCVEWSGSYNFHNSPVHRLGGKGFSTVRHWLLERHRGHKIDTRRNAIYMSCCNPACIEISHMVCKPINHKHKGSTRSAASIIRMSIANQRKIDRDDARAIRASSEPSAVLALRYGVTRETINQIRRGHTHKEFNIFSGLLAA